mmetsp:Transcript_88347/g.166483  ORF Transcript_88347/g.166483 Transcript_88347/m.166483 type:complete len:496 (-) Transcript_88347:63-1550(-)
MNGAREPLRPDRGGSSSWLISLSSAVSCATWKLCLTVGTVFVSVGLLWRHLKRGSQLSSLRNENPVELLPVEIELNPKQWSPVDAELTRTISEALGAGRSTIDYIARGFEYTIDLNGMMQVNKQTGKRRRLRLAANNQSAQPSNTVEADSGAAESPKDGESSTDTGASDTPADSSRSGRMKHLTAFLTSPQAQLRVPSEVVEEPDRLSDEEIEKVFVDNVPGVSEFLYREQYGNYAIRFMVGAYHSGLRAYNDSGMGDHFTWLMRLIVHYGNDKKPGAARHLSEVAEAFMDCQAVQARVIEKVGFEIRGLGHDFRGQVLQLVEDYKTMAVKMLAFEEVVKLGGPDLYYDPPHFESRVIADIGDLVGLGEAEIRRASLDDHANQRFRPFRGEKKQQAAARFRECFDMDALLKAFVAEVNSFGDTTTQESLSRQFLKWVDSGLAPSQKHLVFDEETCTRVEVDEVLALAIMEVIFFGKVRSDGEDRYRGQPVAAFFP